MPGGTANRTVAVKISADVSDYVSNVKKAETSTGELAKAADKSKASHKKSWGEVSKGALVAGGIIGAGVGLAVKAFADFDKSMSRAAAGTSATGAELNQLRAAAIKAGADTQYSATEAADAITAMGKAGVSVKDILGGGLNGALSLAAAGELSVADAGEIAATAMTQFGLSGKDLPHVADLLAAGAGKAQGSVQDLAGALKYVGPVAKGMGVSIEETTGVIAEFASQGIIGEQAGTGLRGILSTLSAPSAAAAGQMKKLGISVYDSRGKFVGLQGVAGQFQAALSGLTQKEKDAALGRIFGNEQLTAARVLYQGGAKAVEEWTKKVDDSGFASRQAAQLTDNLAGDVERLSGSLSTVLISAGSGANEALRGLAQDATKLVNAFGDIPAPIQQGIIKVAAMTAGSLLLAGAAIKVVGALKAAKLALIEVGVTAEGTGRALGVANKAFAALALIQAGDVFGDYVARNTVATQKTDELADSLQDLATKGQVGNAFIQELSSGISPFAKHATSAEEALKQFGNAASKALRPLDDGIGGFNAFADRTLSFGAYSKAFAKYAADLDNALALMSSKGHNSEAQDAFHKLSDAALQAGVPIDELRKAFPKFTGVLQQHEVSLSSANAAEHSLTLTTNGLTDSTGKSVQAAQAASAAQDEYAASLDATHNRMLLLSGGIIGYEAALDAATAAAKVHNKTMDVTTEQGRKNRTALNDLAAASLTYLKTLNEQAVPAGQFNKQLTREQDQLYKVARQFGLSKDAAHRYVVEALGIPKEIDTEVKTPGLKPAHAATDAYRKSIKAVPETITTAATTPGLVAAIAHARDLGGKVKDLPQQRTVNIQAPGLLAAMSQMRQYAEAIGRIPHEVRTSVKAPGLLAAQAQARHLAGHKDGGMIPRGLGGPKQDNLLTKVSSGEFVVQKAAVDYYGAGMLHAINDRAFAGGGLAGAPTGSLARSGSTRGSVLDAQRLTRSLDSQIAALGGVDVRGELAARSVAALGAVANLTAAKVTTLTKALTDTRTAESRTTDKLAKSREQLTNSLESSNNWYLASRSSADAYQGALQALAGSIKENGKSLDAHTVKGRANRQALDQAADAGLAWLKTVLEQRGAGAAFAGQIGAVEKALAAAASHFGLTADQARKYAASVLSGVKASYAATTAATRESAALRAKEKGLTAVIGGAKTQAALAQKTLTNKQLLDAQLAGQRPLLRPDFAGQVAVREAPSHIAGHTGQVAQSGDTYVIHAPTTSAQDLVTKARQAAARRAAIRGRR